MGFGASESQLESEPEPEPELASRLVRQNPLRRKLAPRRCLKWCVGVGWGRGRGKALGGAH